MLKRKPNYEIHSKFDLESTLNRQCSHRTWRHLGMRMEFTKDGRSCTAEVLAKSFCFPSLLGAQESVEKSPND
jgi:hypothetical protein